VCFGRVAVLADEIEHGALLEVAAKNFLSVLYGASSLRAEPLEDLRRSPTVVRWARSILQAVRVRLSRGIHLVVELGIELFRRLNGSRRQGRATHRRAERVGSAWNARFVCSCLAQDACARISDRGGSSTARPPLWRLRSTPEDGSRMPGLERSWLDDRATSGEGV